MNVRACGARCERRARAASHTPGLTTVKRSSGESAKRASPNLHEQFRARSTSVLSELREIKNRAATVAAVEKTTQAQNFRDRMAATGNMALISALMAGFSFTSLSSEIPDEAKSSPVLDHFLVSTSVTVGLSLIMLFQQSMEYSFCMRLLASHGTEAAFELVQSMRWQRRAAELCFVLSIPSFAYSASTLAVLKTVNIDHEAAGEASMVRYLSCCFALLHFAPPPAQNIRSECCALSPCLVLLGCPPCGVCARADHPAFDGAHQESRHMQERGAQTRTHGRALDKTRSRGQRRRIE